MMRNYCLTQVLRRTELSPVFQHLTRNRFLEQPQPMCHVPDQALFSLNIRGVLLSETGLHTNAAP